MARILLPIFRIYVDCLLGASLCSCEGKEHKQIYSYNRTSVLAVDILASHTLHYRVVISSWSDFLYSYDQTIVHMTMQIVSRKDLRRVAKHLVYVKAQ